MGRWPGAIQWPLKNGECRKRNIAQSKKRIRAGSGQTQFTQDSPDLLRPIGSGGVRIGGAPGNLGMTEGIQPGHSWLLGFWGALGDSNEAESSRSCSAAFSLVRISLSSQARVEPPPREKRSHGEDAPAAEKALKTERSQKQVLEDHVRVASAKLDAALAILANEQRKSVRCCRRS